MEGMRPGGEGMPELPCRLQDSTEATPSLDFSPGVQGPTMVPPRPQHTAPQPLYDRGIAPETSEPRPNLPIPTALPIVPTAVEFTPLPETPPTPVLPNMASNAPDVPQSGSAEGMETPPPIAKPGVPEIVQVPREPDSEAPYKPLRTHAEVPSDEDRLESVVSDPERQPHLEDQPKIPGDDDTAATQSELLAAPETNEASVPELDVATLEAALQRLRQQADRAAITGRDERYYTTLFGIHDDQHLRVLDLGSGTALSSRVRNKPYFNALTDRRQAIRGIIWAARAAEEAFTWNRDTPWEPIGEEVGWFSTVRDLPDKLIGHAANL